MKLKRVISMLMTMCICLGFCGCDFIKDTADMVSPPELTGELAPIAKALYAVAGDDCDLKYPSDGKYRSAIVLEDINGDGIFEAFAFYSTSGDETVTMHINVIGRVGDEWKSLADKSMVATGVEMVEFCDLNNDGAKEILVGWDVNGTSEKQLSVFKFDQSQLVQKILQPYTGFLCCDLDENGTNEIFVHQLNSVDKTNGATIFNYDGKEITQTASCVMDGSVKSAEKPLLATMSNGKKAIYIDETIGVDAITEILCYSDGVLSNPLLNLSAGTEKNSITKRAASILTQDIDDDGTPEIPVANDLPNAQNKEEKLYYTNWCVFDGQKLTIKKVTIVNTVDGYFLSVPADMVGNIAATKDIENRQRKIYRYDAQSGELGKLLFTVSAISASRWDGEGYDKGNKVELSRNGTTVFAVELGEGAADYGITTDAIKSSFNLVD